MNNVIKFFNRLLKYRLSIGEVFSLVDASVVGKKAKLLSSYHISQSTINDYTYIAKNAYISYANIGKYCSIGPNFLCGWGVHPVHGISTSPMFYSTAKQNGYSVSKINKIDERRVITIGNDVFIGANVTVLDGVTIGDGAVIGAGAVVSKDIPSYAVAVGCPIRVIKYRFAPDVIDSFLKIAWWNRDELIHEDIDKMFFDINSFISKYS